MMAAIRAGELKQDVTLIEKNSSLGKKLLLSGKGRCNLTNACDLDLFLERFSDNKGQFLRDAFRKFFNNDLMRFFENRGLRLKIERQLRVFPVSNKSGSTLEVLKKDLEKNKVKVCLKAALKEIFFKEKQLKAVLLSNGETISADRVILATGGVSYAFTGSNGEGLFLAKRLGHQIIFLRPGLVPLETRQSYVRLLKGLTLRNIRLTFSDGEKELVSPVGELLFTHFGISGPLVLSFSGKVADWLSEKKVVTLRIDLKPALSLEVLNQRLIREFKANPKKSASRVLKNLLPKSLVEVFLDILKINPKKQANQINQEERKRTAGLLKSLPLTVTQTRPIEEAMITRGGVSLKEINPRTMESRLYKGLYFAGEMIDVDADTGGFNLQAAFSTGYLAGESAATTA
ncbi:MAG: hypothetical protein DRP74_06145 [Candidatus Omnitrophota bacterium]|nr:MAG: hypothetical protein DRP74_06145 [Candidatus Omnitrophota bacterium]